MNKQFEGVYVVAVTPFKADGSFDYKSAKENLDRMIDAGIPGIVILGATGEYMSVSNEEHKTYISEIVPYICSRVKVVVGATREQANDTIELVNHSARCGAHAAMVLTPPYCHPAQDEILENYRYITRHVSIPLVLYNNPGSCGVNIEQDTYKELLQMDGFGIVKESAGCIHKLTQVLNDAPDSVSVFCGCDNIAYESFTAGANGWISMLANVAPKLCMELFDLAYHRNELIEAREIYKILLPALDILESFPKPIQALKYLLNRKYGTGGYVRRPHMELSDEEKEYIVSSMNADILE